MIVFLTIKNLSKRSRIHRLVEWNQPRGLNLVIRRSRMTSTMMISSGRFHGTEDIFWSMVYWIVVFNILAMNIYGISRWSLQISELFHFTFVPNYFASNYIYIITWFYFLFILFFCSVFAFFYFEDVPDYTSLNLFSVLEMFEYLKVSSKKPVWQYPFFPLSLARCSFY